MSMEGVRLITLASGTNENYQRDEGKILFVWYDYDKKTWYKGALDCKELFELLKPHLKEEADRR